MMVLTSVLYKMKRVEIYRSRIKVDDSMINLTAEEVVNKLKMLKLQFIQEIMV